MIEIIDTDMIANDLGLKTEFESKLQTDSAFAKSPGARLNFFYQHSPYWDPQVDLYPVARLMIDAPLSTKPFH